MAQSNAIKTEKGASQPVKTGRKQAAPADNTARKQRPRAADKTAGKQPRAGKRGPVNTGKKRDWRGGDNTPAKTPAVVHLPYLENGTLEEAKGELEKVIPEWGQLDKLQKNELAALVLEKRLASQPVKVKLSRKANGSIAVDMAGDSDALTLLKLCKAFSANSLDGVNARSGELVRYLESVGACNDGRYNAALSFVESMEPRDQAEAMLLVRHYVTHDATIRALSMMGNAEWVPQMATFGNLASKLMARADQQLETLAKLRRGGEQVIKHVHIDNRGGQAVVAEHFVKGGSSEEPRDQSHALGSSMLGYDAERNGVPIASGEGSAALPDARRD